MRLDASKTQLLCLCTWTNQLEAPTILFTSRGFYSSGEPEIDQRNPWWLSSFSFAQINPLLWFFSCFWLRFIEIKVLNEEEISILHILYCYSLQQHVFLAFCNDFDTHRVFAYILLRNKILLFPKWCPKPTRPILCYSSVVNMEKGKFTNFKHSCKINKNSSDDQEKKEIYISRKKVWGLVAL